MRNPIDVLILDDKNHVVKIKENLKPNRILLWNPKFDQVVELPEGSVKKFNIELRSKILFY